MKINSPVDQTSGAGRIPSKCLAEFRLCEDGFVLIMSLLILPVFLGFALLLVDVGRGNNARADLQSIVDAMALAGSRELDGISGARAEARTAMEQLTNPVSMLDLTTTAPKAVTYTTGDARFEIIFLQKIPGDSGAPGNDLTPIDVTFKSTWAATSDANANYVYVRAISPSEFSLDVMLDALFGLPDKVALGATAVAKADSAICDVPPLFICNPFEFVSGAYSASELQTRFAAGDLQSRLIRLHPGGGSTAFPGNFGFLQVDGSMGTSDIRDYFAGGGVPICMRGGQTVDTAPGSRVAMADGINIRFDVMPGPNYGKNGLDYVPAIAENVRKGFIPKKTGINYDDCVPNGAGAADWSDDHIIDLSAGWPLDASGNPDPAASTGENGSNDGAYGFPDNLEMTLPATQVGSSGTPGAYVGTDDQWPLQLYLDRNYGVGTYTVGTSGANYGKILVSGSYETVSSFAGKMPSRYDIYRWEISKGLTTTRSPDPGGEAGAPYCSTEDYARSISSITSVDPQQDPRVLAVAVIDCVTEAESGAGGNTNLNVNTYASIFLSRPMRSWYPSADQTIDVEVIDIQGFGGHGTLDTFTREEAVLVR